MARRRPVVAANPLVPGESVGVGLLSGNKLDELDIELSRDVRVQQRTRVVTDAAVTAERRTRIVAAQILDATTLEEARPSPRYSLAELRAMTEADRAKLEALVEAHGHIPRPVQLRDGTLPEATRAAVADALGEAGAT